MTDLNFHKSLVFSEDRLVDTGNLITNHYSLVTVSSRREIA